MEGVQFYKKDKQTQANKLRSSRATLLAEDSNDKLALELGSCRLPAPTTTSTQHQASHLSSSSSHHRGQSERGEAQQPFRYRSNQQEET
jgi:hypothetical protein